MNFFSSWKVRGFFCYFPTVTIDGRSKVFDPARSMLIREVIDPKNIDVIRKLMKI